MYHPLTEISPPSSEVKECTLHYSNTDIEDIYNRMNNLVPDDKIPVIRKIINQSLDVSQDKIDSHIRKVSRNLKYMARKNYMRYVYLQMKSAGEIIPNPVLEKYLVTKSSKSQSGVLVITVLTSPYPMSHGKKQRFTCKYDCYYCPNQKGQPRSYLRDEPAVLRANQNHFDAVLQFTDRAATLMINGHPVDKIELLVLGGTWSNYPLDYQEDFIRDLFYAANTFNKNKRDRLSLKQEQELNEIADTKIIGITLETRPDCIDAEEVKRFRNYGCTRVQLGIQHTNNQILKKINRGCTIEDAKKAIKLLKDNCFKIDIHLMPNLPGSSAVLDREMFDQVLYDHELQVDQWKIYPCEVTPWTVIKKWYDNGEFVPYPDEEMENVIMDVQEKIHPRIRINRIMRDIPSQYILGGINNPNIREDLADKMKKQGRLPNCIRCREIRDRSHLMKDAILYYEWYKGSGSDEVFISYEVPEDISGTTRLICGFVRLRLPSMVDSDSCFPELQNTALIRELHVYGQLVATSTRNKDIQHTGMGKSLMHEAERIARNYGYSKIAVISGVGVRNFYRKIGYSYNSEQKGEFLIKKLNSKRYFNIIGIISFGIVFYAVFYAVLISL